LITFRRKEESRRNEKRNDGGCWEGKASESLVKRSVLEFGWTSPPHEKEQGHVRPHVGNRISRVGSIAGPSLAARFADSHSDLR